MKYLYYPGCSLRSTGRAYEDSILAVFKKLDITLEELNDWNCCGASTYVSIDEMDAFALAARNLALAEQQSADETIQLVAPCSACYLVLSKTGQYIEHYPDVRDKINLRLKRAGLQYGGRVTIKHPVDVLVNDYGLEKISHAVLNSLKGLNVASYYGCQMVRPFAQFDHTHYPQSLDMLMQAIGAEPVDWPLKTRCCGGALTGTIQEAGLRLNRLLLKEAQKRKAEMIITCCPLCQHNLECYQERINRTFEEKIDIPVAYFTQILGLALGLSEKELGMHRLFKKPPFAHLLSSKGATVNAW